MIAITGPILSSTWGYTTKYDSIALPILTDPNLSYTNSTNWLPISNWVKAPNGSYYSIPGQQRTVIKYTPNSSISGSNQNYETGSFTIISKSLDDGLPYYLQDGGEKYGHGVLAQNGKIYAFPYRSTLTYSSSILEIDPTLDAYKMYNYTWTDLGFQMFVNCILGGDGWIYGAPNAKSSAFGTTYRIFRFHPETKILQSSSATSAVLGGGWDIAAGGLFATGSYVYFAPRGLSTGKQGKILKLDTTQFAEGTVNGMSLIDFPTIFQATGWGNITFQGSNVVSSSQGHRVFLTPRMLSATKPLTSSLFFDPSTDTFTIVKNQSGSSTSGITIPANNFVGGSSARSHNGNLNFFAFTANNNITVKHGTTSSFYTNVFMPNNRGNLIPSEFVGASIGNFINGGTTDKYKSLYSLQSGSSNNFRYTSSLMALISVKGYYNNITDFSIPNDIYVLPNPIAGITSSLYNFYYNHW
jgi:hypothetical protein